jgi:hypothetical protein
MSTVSGARRLAGRPSLATAAQTIEIWLVATRRWLGTMFDHAQLMLQSLEARGEVDDAAWVEKALASVKDGSIKKELDRQPTPEQIVDEWRSSRAS